MKLPCLCKKPEAIALEHILLRDSIKNKWRQSMTLGVQFKAMDAMMLSVIPGEGALP